MSELIYIDTNVYIDYLQDRSDGIMPLGEFAYQLLKRSMNCEFNIVVSDLVLFELDKQKQTEKFKVFYDAMSRLGKIVNVSTDKIDLVSAKDLPIHKADAVHAVLAIKSGAKALITMNIRDFLPVSQKIIVRRPNEI